MAGNMFFFFPPSRFFTRTAKNGYLDLVAFSNVSTWVNNYLRHGHKKFGLLFVS